MSSLSCPWPVRDSSSLKSSTVTQEDSQTCRVCLSPDLQQGHFSKWRPPAFSGRCWVMEICRLKCQLLPESQLLQAKAPATPTGLSSQSFFVNVDRIMYFFFLWGFQDRVSWCNTLGCLGTCSEDQVGLKFREICLLCHPSLGIKGMYRHCPA